MILIEKQKCEDALHARKIEREFIERLGATLNKSIPTRTQYEYNQDNRVRINERQKLYDDTKRDMRKEHRKQYYEANKEKMKEYQKPNSYLYLYL